MADMTIPPWLTRDYDPVGTFVKSYQIGANISMEQSRLAEQQRQANMEAEYKREQMAANIMKAQQDLAVEQSKYNQDMAFKQKELNQRKQLAEMTARQAAMDSMAQQAHWQALEEAQKAKPEIVRRPDGSAYMINPDGTVKEVGTGVKKPEVPFVRGGLEWKDGKWVELPKVPKEEYKTVTEKFEKVEGTPEVPGTPAKTNWFGRVTPAIPAIPAVPAQPERTEVRKVPITSSGVPIPPKTTEEKVYKSESEARADGKKSGDTIKVMVNGKVRTARIKD